MLTTKIESIRRRIDLNNAIKQINNDLTNDDSDMDLIHIMEAYKPDIIVKGSDHRETSQLSKKYCKEVNLKDESLILSLM